MASSGDSSTIMSSTQTTHDQGSYTFEIIEFKAFQGFSRLFQGTIGGHFSDKKPQNYHMTAPPSGSISNLHDHHRPHDAIFTRFYTLLMA